MATTEHDLSHAEWRKSPHSGSGNCIETASVPDGIAVRDSADSNGPALFFTCHTWTTFAAVLKN
jgi:hypothetical protein